MEDRIDSLNRLIREANNNGTPIPIVNFLEIVVVELAYLRAGLKYGIGELCPPELKGANPVVEKNKTEQEIQAEYEATLDLCEKCGAEVFEKMIGDESYRTCPNGCAIGN